MDADKQAPAVVYVLEWNGGYDGSSLYGIFSSALKAKQFYAKKFPDSYGVDDWLPDGDDDSWATKLNAKVDDSYLAIVAWELDDPPWTDQP